MSGGASPIAAAFGGRLVDTSMTPPPGTRARTRATGLFVSGLDGFRRDGREGCEPFSQCRDGDDGPPAGLDDPKAPRRDFGIEPSASEAARLYGFLDESPSFMGVSVASIRIPVHLCNRVFLGDDGKVRPAGLHK
jgi:hypothetical protein